MACKVIFDREFLKSYRKADPAIKEVLRQMGAKLESEGLGTGKRLSANIFEIKRKRPPIRVYYCISGDSVILLEFEMKKSKKRQQATIRELKVLEGVRLFFQVL